MIDNYEMFTRKAISSIETAIESASSMGHTYVGTDILSWDFYRRTAMLRLLFLKRII